MNKKLNFKFIFIVLSLSIVFTSCSDWTETSSVDLIESNIETDNPELYAQYLSNLREYRNKEHKTVYVWFDNVKDMPKSRGEQISAIPDSVDIVNLVNPDDLSSWVISDMESLSLIHI